MIRFAFMFACLVVASYGFPAAAFYFAAGWEWWPVARVTLAAVFLFNIELDILFRNRTN